MDEKEVVDKIKKIKTEIKKLDRKARELKTLIESAEKEAKEIEPLKFSENARERMEYLEAIRVYVCLKNDLANINLSITFLLDKLEVCNAMLDNLNIKDLSM